MAKPTQSIFPLENGKLITSLDCNNLQLINLDDSNLSIGGGGAPHTVTFVGDYSADVITANQAVFLDGDIGATITGAPLSANAFIVLVTSPTVIQISETLGTDTGITFAFDRAPATGNDTGTTTAILKGDGDHGFADAVIDLDYASVASVQLRELSADHDTDFNAHQAQIDSLNGQVAVLNASVTDKADLTYVDAQLAAKADDADLQAYITSNDAEVALKAYTSTVNSALATKADTSLVTTGLATKEPLLPTTASDGFVLVRDADDTWRFVDPVTLGSTNATYTDGSTHSNFTFNSTLAVFTANDTGLTIVAPGDIPSDTTITFVNATTVTLSNAATTTAIGTVTFTLLNRFLPGSSGGTVTSVGVTPSSPTLVGSLFAASVSNASTSAVVTFAANPGVGANTFYGNGTAFTGTAGFMTAGAARTSLGGTTVGQALFQLANPSQVGFIQTNANNTVSALTSAATLSAIGGESALTFSAPLSRGTVVGPNNISIPVVNGTNPARDGYLTSGDYVTFQNKIGPSTKIITTAPITIDGVSGGLGLDLTANRTIAMPRSAGNADGTGKVNGYLHGDDFVTFVNKPPNSRALAVTAPLTMSPGVVTGTPPFTTTTGDLSANRTVGIPKASTTVDGYLAAADFLRFNLGGGASINVSQGYPPPAVGTATIDPAAVPPITKVYLTSPLNQNLNIILPPAAAYAANNLSIEIIDVVTGGAAPGALVVTVSRSGSDTVDGLTTPITLAEGTTYTRFFPNAANRWFSTKYFVDSFKDPVDQSKKVTVSLGNPLAIPAILFPTQTTRNLTLAPGGDSVTVVPNPLIPGDASRARSVVRSVEADGSLSVSAITSTDIVPTEKPVFGTADSTITNDGTVDTVRLDTALDGIHSYTFPNAANYSSGETIRFYDATNSLTATKFVRVIGTALNRFNGDVSIDIKENYFNRIFVANPVAVPPNWTVSTFGGTSTSGLSTDPYHPVTPSGGVASLSCDPNVVENHHIVTLSSNTVLAMTGTLPSGSSGKIIFRDTNNGGHTITVPNAIGRIPNALANPTAGIFTLSTGTGTVEDEWGWDSDGTNINYYPLGLKMVAAAPNTTFTTIALPNTGPDLTSGFTDQAAGVSSIWVATKFVADGGVGAGNPYTIGKIRLRLYRPNPNTVPNYGLKVEIREDSGGSPSTPAATRAPNSAASSTVPASNLALSEGDVDFDTSAILVSGQTYWIVLYGDSGGHNQLVSDGVITNGAATFTSASVAQFAASDVGRVVTGTGIPGATQISVVNSPTSATLSKNATASGTGTVTITNRYYVNWAYHTLAGTAMYRAVLAGTPWLAVPGTKYGKYTMFTSP